MTERKRSERNSSQTRPRIVHVFFGQVRKLSPLMAELRSLSSLYTQTLVLPGYDQDEPYLQATLPDVEILYVRMLSRKWSVRQTPLLKLLRFAEFTLRGMLLLHRRRATLAVAHDMPAVLPLLPRLLLRPRHVVFHAHELWTEAAENLAPLRPLWRLLERFTVRRAGRVIVPEANRARIVHEEYGAPVLPAIVKNIPADPPPYMRSRALRDALGLDDHALCLLYQGLLAESRCVLELVQAVALLPSNAHLVLIGIGEPRYLQRLREAGAGLQGRLHFFDWMNAEDLRAYTASADVGVLLYRDSGRNNYYAAPNKLYEYLFAGIPVVASAFPGLQPLVEDGHYGACADPARPDYIARALNAAAAIAPGADIAGRSRATWRWSDEAAVLDALYKKVMENKHAF